MSNSALLTPLISSAAMRAIVDDRARLQRMLDFEVALARAQAAVGVIPALAIDAIAAAASAERYDIKALGEEAVTFGNVAIPLIRALSAEVAKTDAAAAGYVHWGATSQDVIDTALVLELRAAIDALVSDLNRAVEAFATLAGRHRRTAAVARTWMQHAIPVPFGLKLAGYAAALARSRERLRRLRKDALVLQFGGAAGTLASLNERGLEVSERLAALLDLPLPEAPWHSPRDRLAEVASAFGILTGTCGKIARDVSLLMQTEVAEAFEPAAPGRGTSSTMPHKRNPTAAALALVTSGAVAAIVDIAQGLEIDSERMRVNLGETRGLIMAEAVTFALAGKLGKQEARTIVEEASRRAAATKRELQEVLAEDERVKPHLNVGELARLFEPMGYQGSAQTFIDRIVGSLQLRGSKRS